MKQRCSMGRDEHVWMGLALKEMLARQNLLMSFDPAKLSPDERKELRAKVVAEIELIDENMRKVLVGFRGTVQ